MFEIKRKEVQWGGRALSLETGRIARQADGAVLATYGGTVVLCTVCAQDKTREDIDFLPLGVHYQEKAFAAGRIPGGFFRREGRPSEKETLVSRLIDRPLRPLFPKTWFRETQVLCTVLSYDHTNEPDVLAMIGSSAALAVSGLPISATLGGIRVGYKKSSYIINPTAEDLQRSKLDLVVAGTSAGVLMVESQAEELSEKIMLGAVVFGHKQMQPIIAMIEELAQEAGQAPTKEPPKSDRAAKIESLLKDVRKELSDAYAQTDPALRKKQLAESKEAAIQSLPEEQKRLGANVWGSLEKEVVRNKVLETSKRVDGRGLAEIRPISCAVGLLAETHGSALFTRGETQAIATATLGTSHDEQIIDAMAGEYREHFLLHYNFPPYSVGEVSMRLGPGRREIGHGKLAWRALRPLLPSKEDFPYTIRATSEITESNGSSSMATVCGCSLALMDAGVPLARPVAGIAMGLIKEGDDFAVLSDIVGQEDHLGDMDFKVAGTTKGVTSLQMDLKITSISPEIMKDALTQAYAGRMEILEKMSQTLDAPREEISKNAPQVVSLRISKEKVRELIGPGGKVIRSICETTGAKIDVQDDGSVQISAVNQSALDAAIKQVEDITASPEVGRIYQGKVVKVAEFGAFVSFLGPRDGLVHISELSTQRVRRVEDIVQRGATVHVKCIGIEQGRIRLSMKRVNQSTGRDLEA